MRRSWLLAIALFTGSSTSALACTMTALFSPYDKVLPVLVPLIDGAKHTIHCSLFGESEPDLTDAISRAAKRGVQVQIGLDRKQSSLASSQHRQLRRAGAEVYIKQTGVLEHNKFCIYDGAIVSVGSWNWSRSAQGQDNSELILRDCQAVVDKFEAAFQRIKERDDHR